MINQNSNRLPNHLTMNHTNEEKFFSLDFFLHMVPGFMEVIKLYFWVKDLWHATVAHDACNICCKYAQ